MPWQWDRSTARYRDSESGKFLSKDDALGYVDASIGAGQDAAIGLADSLLEGRVSVADWRDLMRREIKDEYIRQYLLGRGGLSQMTQTDWGSIGGMIADQYRYLDAWALSLEDVDPSTLSAGAFRDRAGMYLNSAREGYERGTRRAVVASGEYTLNKWVLGNTEVHCATCMDYSSMGWVPIGTIPAFPGDGSTECLTHCDCHYDYM